MVKMSVMIIQVVSILMVDITVHVTMDFMVTVTSVKILMNVVTVTKLEPSIMSLTRYLPLMNATQMPLVQIHPVYITVLAMTVIMVMVLNVSIQTNVVTLLQ